MEFKYCAKSVFNYFVNRAVSEMLNTFLATSFRITKRFSEQNIVPFFFSFLETVGNGKQTSVDGQHENAGLIQMPDWLVT